MYRRENREQLLFSEAIFILSLVASLGAGGLLNSCILFLLITSKSKIFCSSSLVVQNSGNCFWPSSSTVTLGPNHPSNRSSERPPQKFQYGGQNAPKGFWSEFLRSPLQTSREKSRGVKTGYLKERNDGQIHVLEKTSFVLICKLPGLFLKRPCLKHAWSGERRQFTC